MRKIKLKRLLGQEEGFTLVTVNKDQILFYYGDMYMHRGQLVNVTTIVFNDATIYVLETPEQVDRLVEGYKDE